MGGVKRLDTGQRRDKYNSLDWKLLNWSCSGNLSSQGSGFNHSSSSKSLGSADSSEVKAELRPKNVTLVQSLTADAAACVTSPLPSEGTTSRKKPRLNWGEGLAKYEKKKVESPEVCVSRDGAVISAVNAEPAFSQSSNVADKGPRVVGFSDCASPATPSVAHSSLPGIEEKTFDKAVNVAIDVANLCSSLSLASWNHLEGFCFNLENLDISSISDLGSSLIELLQSDDPSSVDSSFVRSSSINKLLIWKGDVFKVLEMTESEIDSLQNELKSLKFESGSRCQHPATSSSFPGESNVTPFYGQGPASSNVPYLCPVQVVSYGDDNVEKIPLRKEAVQDIEASSKCFDIDSPGTAASKFVEPESLAQAVPSVDLVKHAVTSADLDAPQSTSILLRNFPPHINEEAAAACQDFNMLIDSKIYAPLYADSSLCIDGVDNLCNLMLVSNKESAVQASEVFNKLFPRDHCKIDLSTVTNLSSWQSDAFVREKFANRKRFLRFKEKVVMLKFKAFHQIWKEDMRLLSMGKYQAKSHKKSELSMQTTHSRYQKYQSPHCSRFPSSGLWCK